MSLRKLKWRGIGRLELLGWLNEFLETDYTKIEHLADGIAYCQVFDALYPGKVNLQLVNFQARTEMECERNMRVLRRTFHLCDVRKEIPIRKLVQGIFQEHFEFLHWVHDYVQRTCPDAVRSYHGFKRRQETQGLSSQTQNSTTNTNLIPKYSNSMKLLRDAYIDAPADPAPEKNEADADDSPVNASVLDSVDEEQHLSTALANEDLSGMDPSLEFARYSFRSTLRAKHALLQLDECMESLDVGCSKPKANSKKNPARGSNAQPASRISGRQSKPKAFDDPTWPDPMMCRSISDLLECLESELLGRVKDMEYLENSVKLLSSKP